MAIFNSFLLVYQWVVLMFLTWCFWCCLERDADLVTWYYHGSGEGIYGVTESMEEMLYSYVKLCQYIHTHRYIYIYVKITHTHTYIYIYMYDIYVYWKNQNTESPKSRKNPKMFDWEARRGHSIRCIRCMCTPIKNTLGPLGHKLLSKPCLSF